MLVVFQKKKKNYLQRLSALVEGEISEFCQVSEPTIYGGRARNFSKSQNLQYRVAEVGIHMFHVFSLAYFTPKLVFHDPPSHP